MLPADNGYLRSCPVQGTAQYLNDRIAHRLSGLQMPHSNWSLWQSLKYSCCVFFTRLPADFFDETEQDSANEQLSKGSGPSLLSGNYDDDDDEEEEQDQSSQSCVVRKSENPPPTQEVTANSLPAGIDHWNSKWFSKEKLCFDWWWKGFHLFF